MKYKIFDKNQLEIKPEHDELYILWLGGASFYIKDSAGNKMLIDPYLSNSAYDYMKPFVKNPKKSLSRLDKPVFGPGDLETDFILTTHDHLDHLDPYTIKEYRNLKNVIFVGPSSCCNHFERIGIKRDKVIELKAGESIRLVKDIVVFGTYAKHRGPFDLEKSMLEKSEVYGSDDSIGFLVNFGNISVYHTGDTSFEDALFDIENKKIDVLLLGANGVADNLTPEEGALLTKRLKPKMVIPQHYGVIPCTNFDPISLVEVFEKYHIDSSLVILKINESVIFKK